MSTTTRIGNYTIIRQLGAGGMAQIFEARNSQSGLLVALKLQGDASISIDDLRRFRREAEVLQSMSHPNVITVYDVGTAGGRPYIAVELVKGGSIEQALQQRGAFSPAEALRLMAAILDGLAHTHARNLIHRDIKPANVLLRPDGTPVLADFDLARPPRPSAAARITAEGERLGTPAYMAPEQIRGDMLDPRTDLYACGVMLYEMLTGRLPFEGDLTQIIVGHLQKQPPSLRAALPHASPYLELLISNLLAKQSPDRPQSAEVVRTALLDIQAGRPTTILQPRPANPTTPAASAVPTPAVASASQLPPAAPWVRHGTKLISGVFVVLLLALAGVLFQRVAISNRVPIPATVLPIASTAIEVDIASPEPIVDEVTLTPGDQPLATAEPTATEEPLERATAVSTEIASPEGPQISEPTALHDLEAEPMVLLRPIEDTNGGSFSVGSITITLPKSGTEATVYGELRNEDDLPREVMQLSAQFANDLGTPQTDTLVIGQQILGPREATAFSIKVAINDANRAQSLDELTFRIRSEIAQSIPQPSFSIKNLFILSRTEDGTPVYAVIGTLNKRGDGNLANLQVLLIFYDSDDNVRGFNRIKLDNVSALVASDQQIDLIASVQPTIEGVVSYRAVVQ